MTSIGVVEGDTGSLDFSSHDYQPILGAMFSSTQPFLN